jgi:hypothetical protein
MKIIKKTKIPCAGGGNNSGVRVEILRAEALFFLDFDFVEPSGSLVTFFDQAKKVTKSQENGLLLKYWPTISYIDFLRKIKL